MKLVLYVIPLLLLLPYISTAQDFSRQNVGVSELENDTHMQDALKYGINWIFERAAKSRGISNLDIIVTKANKIQKWQQNGNDNYYFDVEASNDYATITSQYNIRRNSSTGELRLVNKWNYNIDRHNQSNYYGSSDEVESFDAGENVKIQLSRCQKGDEVDESEIGNDSNLKNAVTHGINWIFQLAADKFNISNLGVEITKYNLVCRWQEKRNTYYYFDVEAANEDVILDATFNVKTNSKGQNFRVVNDWQYNFTSLNETEDYLDDGDDTENYLPGDDTPPIDSGAEQCYVGGCSGQLCTNDPNAISTCEWTAAYACYAKATCAKQAYGQCGWTNTQELQECLANPPSTDPVPDPDPVPEPGPCYVGGCSKQLCTDDPNAVSTCELRPDFVCYANATCERQDDGTCGWTSTSELQECLANPPSTDPVPDPDPVPEPGPCYVGGCSNELCTDQEGAVSDCSWDPTFACYTDATCERQDDGTCGWTSTSELQECLANAGSEIKECYIGGCSSELCTDDPNATSNCDWSEEFVCYTDATCQVQSDGSCGWTNTPQLQQCLANPADNS